MSSTTNIQSVDSFLSKSSLSTQTIHTRKKWIFRKLIKLFLSFNIDRKETDNNTDQHAKLVLRAFFIYMIFVSNVLIVAFLSRSNHKFFITNAFEYHIINAKFPVKSSWLERNMRNSPYKNALHQYRDAFIIDFNQIATFDDVNY